MFFGRGLGLSVNHFIFSIQADFGFSIIEGV